MLSSATGCIIKAKCKCDIICSIKGIQIGGNTMKKLDLHIHTKAAIIESEFEFSIEKLKEYVTKMKVDCIAITNHNTFDLPQFEKISQALDIVVLPGIELTFENGHLLLIADGNELGDFNSRCEKVEQFINKGYSSIKLKQLKEIYVDLSKYLLIPHYQKTPAISDEIIKQLNKDIYCGEVNSVKKFIYCTKQKESLVPVLFSDIRIDKELVEFPIRQTFFDLSTINLNAIKLCLRDKNKVSLSEKDGHALFQILDNGLEISTGLNVMLGERSSGKTYTLNKINKNFDNVKYIKQFSLLETDEEAAKKEFDDLLTKKHSSISEDYLKEFKEVVKDVSDINLDENKRNIDNYIKSLLKNAEETERADAFSKAALFNESDFMESDLENLKKVIGAVVTLIENIEYADIIEKHVEKDSLKRMAISLMTTYSMQYELNLKKRWINDLVLDVRKELQWRTSATTIKDVDFFKIISDKQKIEKFYKVSSLVRQKKEIFRREIQGFKIVARTEKYCGAAELKARSGKMISFSDAYSKYEDPYEFLRRLKAIDKLEPVDYYKYFVNIKNVILNKYDCPVSGGERAEFNLLQKVNDALEFDMLLIDEPESSFDNLFLKNELNDLIKTISKTIPVIIVTHNNTVGASIKPDYIIYTKKEVVDDKVSYHIYSGRPTDKMLKGINGEIIKNHEILLNCLEAGTDAYQERGMSYEMLKD